MLLLGLKYVTSPLYPSLEASDLPYPSLEASDLHKKVKFLISSLNSSNNKKLYAQHLIQKEKKIHRELSW